MLNLGELTSPEKKLWQAFRTGQPLDLSPGDGGANDPRDGARWGPERTLRASVLIELLTGEEWPEDCRPHTLMISFAAISERLDLHDHTLLRSLDLFGCHLGEEMSLIGAETRRISLAGCDVAKLTASQMRARGKVVLRDSHVGQIDLREARIEGSLDLQGAELSGEDDISLCCDGARVEGSVFCNGGFRATGGVRMVNARVTELLNLNDAEISDSVGRALICDRATIDGGMFGDRLKTAGTVSLKGSYIKGALSLSGAHLENASGRALVADTMQVDGIAFLSGIHTTGELRLPAVHILGPLDLSGAQLKCADGRALTADRIRVDDSLLCSDGFSADGEVRFFAAKIEGQLSLDGARLENTSGLALDLEQASVGHLLLPRGSPPSGVLDLTDTKVTRLDDDWPRTRYSAAIGGLTYETINPMPDELQTRLEWLGEAASGYLPQPYEQLAKVLRTAGRDDAARRIAIERERRRRGQLNRLGKVWSDILYVTVGYGYQAWRGLIAFAVLVGGSWAVSAWAKAHHHLATLVEKGHPQPQFHAWLYALDSVLPVVNLGQKNYWSPTGFAQYWHAASILAGWLIGTLLIAAVTTKLVRE